MVLCKWEQQVLNYIEAISVPKGLVNGWIDRNPRKLCGTVNTVTLTQLVPLWLTPNSEILK